VVSTNVAAELHVEGCGRAAFFFVAFDAYAVQVVSSEEQAFYFVRVAVIVKVYGSIGCEERAELVFSEGVWV